MAAQGPGFSGRVLYRRRSCFPADLTGNHDPVLPLTDLLVLAERGRPALARLKLGPAVLCSEPASASWSQARACFLLPPVRISPGKGSILRNLEGDQDPGAGSTVPPPPPTPTTSSLRPQES